MALTAYQKEELKTNEYYCPHEDTWHSEVCAYGIPEPTVWRKKTVTIPPKEEFPVNYQKDTIEAPVKEIQKKGMLSLLLYLVNQNSTYQKFKNLKLHISLSLPIKWFK